MEQPRFGGVALPPLSTPRGEGKSPGSVANTMESTRLATVDHHVTPDQRSGVRGTDPDVQKLMDILRQLGISPDLERHKMKHERQRETGARSVDSGVYCKNLLLKDKKGQAYLIVCGENDTADLHVVKYHLSAQGNLHFASKESLWSLLQVHPGAVSPLALIHSSGDVRVLIDATLVKKIDREVTKLYFHPLKAELQVGLTLSQLKTFLHHCGVTLETLPSLTSYSAGRRYVILTGGYHNKRKLHQEKLKTKFKQAEAQEEGSEETSPPQQAESQGEIMDQAENTFIQHSGLFGQLGISVETVSAKGNDSSSSYTILPCKSVYLKDKRNNYFLFVCHEHQKVDYSTLKMQLKPKKKIIPLDGEELWSLLHLHENQEHPFALAQLTQPRFLVAISDNLYYKGNTVLTFPHPSDLSLRLKITLKHLQTFINNISHDLIAIQMKGNIEEMQAISVSPARSSPPKVTEEKCAHSPDPVDEKQCQLLPDGKVVPASSPAGQGNNLFFYLTASLREWIWRYTERLGQLLNHYLPNQISAMLRRMLFWDRMLTSGNSNEDLTDQSEEHSNGLASREKEKKAKIAKLQQLIEQSGIQVDLRETQPYERFLIDDAERCKTYLLEDDLSRPFIVLCTEDDDPPQRNLRRLRTAFRSRSALRLANDAAISHHLSWSEESSMSWTQEDLNPMALMDMNRQALGRIRVGMTGALYSFLDTMLIFDLPFLGVTLRMNCDDLEKMIKCSGFCIVYLP